MPTFTYQAKQGPAQVTEGTIQAATQDEAVDHLLKAGLVPVSITLAPDGQAPPPPSSLALGQAVASARRAHLALSSKERHLFVRQLTSLIRAKVELVPAISILRDQSISKPLARLLEDLELHMRDGNPFSEALARHPRVFNDLFITAIQAGETAGKLDEILERLVAFADEQEQLESRLKTALAYPLLLGLMGGACVTFFIWFVVPRMSSLFAQLGGLLPWPTKMLIDLSGWLSRDWAWGLGGLLVGGWASRTMSQWPVVAAALQRLAERAPFLGEIVLARQIGRFTRTLQLLLDSGLPIFYALEVARPTLGSRYLEAQMKQVHDKVKQGNSVSQSLQEVGCFPPLVNRLIGVGETGGNLTGVLDELARYYERSLDESLRIGTALIEPVMILLMGVVVGFCVLAMILPIFQMTQLAR